MKRLIVAGILLLLAAPAQATHLSGSYQVGESLVGDLPTNYCLKLVSGGPQGIYSDQGSASLVATPNSQSHSKYGPPPRSKYIGQYQLYQNHFSLVVGDAGEYARYWFLMTADLNKKQWAHGLFYNYLWYHFRKYRGFSQFNGTFTSTRVKGGCQ